MSRSLSITVLAAVCGSHAIAGAQVSFHGLGLLPGADNCYAQGLSADGQVAAGYCGMPEGLLGFRWKAGVLTDLPVPTGAGYSEGGPMNSDGSIMAGLVGPNQRPARWTEASGTMVDLGFPANTNHLPLSISEDGATIWGFGGNSPITPRVYRWTAVTSLQYLPLPAGYSASGGGRASADGTIVVGSLLSGGINRPIRWVNGVPSTPTLPPGITTGDAASVSANGLVMVGVMGDGVFRHMFRWTQAGGFQDLGGDFAIARDTNADGSVIVGWTYVEELAHAVFWTQATGIVDLNTYLISQGIDLSGWMLDSAYTVSGDGRTILGQGTHNGVQEAWIVSLGSSCYANCDGSTAAPTLNTNDFQCFLNRFASAQSYANCDGSNVAPVLNINDFQCFINRFAAGCS